ENSGFGAASRPIGDKSPRHNDCCVLIGLPETPPTARTHGLTQPPFTVSFPELVATAIPCQRRAGPDRRPQRCDSRLTPVDCLRTDRRAATGIRAVRRNHSGIDRLPVGFVMAFDLRPD